MTKNTMLFDDWFDPIEDAVRESQRRTKQAEALIAGAYLSGTNTRRVRRALSAVFKGAVGKDVVSRESREGRQRRICSADFSQPCLWRHADLASWVDGSRTGF
jgi:hypothetical protein